MLNRTIKQSDLSTSSIFKQQRSRPYDSFFNLEPLERRLLLTTTLFLDFGAGVGIGNTISIAVEDFRDIFGSNTGTDLGNDSMGDPSPFNDTDILDFTPLNYDFNGDSFINNQDLADLASAVVPNVQRALEPFDINISIASATDFTDPVTSVGNNVGDSSGEFDAYLFVMAVSSGGVGIGTGLRGQAAISDLAGQSGNTVDEAAITFADNVLFNTTGTQGTAQFNANLAQRLAYTSTHEAFHTFSYVHTPDENNSNPAASANQRLMASGDVIRRGSNTRNNPFMVTRFDLQHLGATVPEPNNYLLAANDSDIGLRDTDGDTVPDLAYLTGTGAHDEVILTANSDVDVDVNAYSNSARTSLIASESYTVDLTNDTEGEILVDAGINNDEVQVDVTINASLRIRGGTGIDGITTENDLLTLNSGGLTGTYTPGSNGDGSVSYAGGAQVDYMEFENVEAADVPIDTVMLNLNSNNIDEGDSVQLTVDFINIDTLDQHTVTISWGDGSSNTVAVLNAGDRQYMTSHTYVDDHPSSGTSSDGFTIHVDVVDEDGDSGDANAGIVVNNVAPSINPINLSASSINESQSVTVSGSFNDPALGVTTETFTGSVLWSDGVVTALSINQTTGAFSTTRLFLDDHPTTGTPSDTFTVDITINDDDLGTDTRTSPTLTVFNVDPVITSFESDATFEDKGMEGEPVNVTGTFTDIGILDTHTATVDWGDGSAPEPLALVQGAGFGSVSGSHIYTFGGVYTVTMTLTDDDTGSDQQTTLAVITGVGVNDGVLYIVGSNEDDAATANAFRKDRIRVRATFIPEVFRDFDLTLVDNIIAYLCDGDDKLYISSNVKLPVVAHGGDDNDILKGGRGFNVLLGNGGNDFLIGHNQSILIGGQGNDRMVGANKGDVLIGGRTSIDGDDNALLAAAMAWSDNDTYDNRVTAVNSILTSVLDDNDVDLINGSAGLDLFYDGNGDRLLDVKPRETVL